MENQEVQNETEMDNSSTQASITGDTEAQKETQSDETTSESPITPEQTEGEREIPLNSGERTDEIKESSQRTNENNRQLLNDIDKKKSGFMEGLIDMLSGTNINIYNGLVDVHNFLLHNHKSSPSYQLVTFIDSIKSALDLIDRHIRDKEALQRNIEEIYRSNESLKEQNYKYKQSCTSLQSNLDRYKREISDLKNNKYGSEANYRKQIETFKNNLNCINLEYEKIKKEKEDAVGKITELETNRGKLIAEIASLKRNTGTHYDGTSTRPQHHILEGEYRTLKEQYFDPLANSLFNSLLSNNPEFKQQRREKINDIKAIISANVFIAAQAIMQGENNKFLELPTGIMEDIERFFSQKIKLNTQANNQALLPQTIELLKRAASIEQGKIDYPVPGKWEEQDFQLASIELRDRLYQGLELDSSSLTPDIQAETQKVIQIALRFLESANLADPPAFFSLEKEGSPFRYDYHEAAKGYDDDGKIIKAIYPVYLVNSEPKVKAVVLTKSSEQTSPGSAPSNSIGQPMCLGEKDSFEMKRKHVIESVKRKWYINKISENETILEKLSKVDNPQIIEELWDLVLQSDIDLSYFDQRINVLLR